MCKGSKAKVNERDIGGGSVCFKGNVATLYNCVNIVEFVVEFASFSFVENIPMFANNCCPFCLSNFTDFNLCKDIFCGVVSMGAENRAWRQRTGRLAQYLSKEATQVSRIFCGLEQRLK